MPLGFGLPVSGRITTKKNQKKNFKIYFPVLSKGYFTEEGKISPPKQKKRKEVSFLDSLTEGVLWGFPFKKRNHN